jgi:hypothetical protein
MAKLSQMKKRIEELEQENAALRAANLRPAKATVPTRIKTPAAAAQEPLAPPRAEQ